MNPILNFFLLSLSIFFPICSVCGNHAKLRARRGMSAALFEHQHPVKGNIGNIDYANSNPRHFGGFSGGEGGGTNSALSFSWGCIN